MNDPAVRWPSLTAPVYILFAWVAPLVLVWWLVRQGLYLSDAVVAALAFAVGVLCFSLGLFVKGVRRSPSSSRSSSARGASR
jgi:hypothetical protein